ncbi:molybdopterin molybdotransferase MoeA [Eggerthellaceae bacterium zg-1084]|uniref:molybdopterin molybdotransferase MoeA n=1 Tax=Berryella wangjianweii TaxID=2734634 RepID=UPI001555786D|nr:gephyrin-like molybdotransferase Glp [Berryella wangjianweii]NPD31561.1 molybdopterin molybdotransferase MoeA [Berryella wangjianweii]
MREMISVEEARDLVLSSVSPLDVQTVDLLGAAGRPAAVDLHSDIDIAPFAHSAMDGFALRAAQIAGASPDTPVELDVVAEVAAGDFFDGDIPEGACVRIMTGAPLPDAADSVVKYEIVPVISGEGREGGRVRFEAPTAQGSNVRAAGEEARAGEAIVRAGEVINTAGVGFLAACGVTEVPVHRRPRVAILSIGSELVDASDLPGRGKIRNSNAYALEACAVAAGAQVDRLPIVQDSLEQLAAQIRRCVSEYDFVITSGGASNGDFDFIKPAIQQTGELLMTTVNMRPGKAQAFGVVDGVPVFGLPGNPAAAYLGFELLIRPALRKMQGYSQFERPVVSAHLARDYRRRDPRRIYLRSTLTRDAQGRLVVEPASNQSSGLFGVIQRSNCFVIVPEGDQGLSADQPVTCLLLDVSEDVAL